MAVKKLFALISFTFLALTMVGGIYAQEGEITSPEQKNSGRPFVVFSEGAAFSWLTRIIKQTGRSNFVFNDFLLGLYFRMDMENIKYVNPMLRLAVLYPLTSTFNKFPQKPKNPLHLGADMVAGARFDILNLKYLRLNIGPGVHMFFLNSDRWNYFELGGAAFVGMELPLTKRWTLLCNFFASIDYGNLGANRLIEPFDICYQYQVDIGVRYSKKLENKTSLFSQKSKETESSVIVR